MPAGGKTQHAVPGTCTRVGKPYYSVIADLDTVFLLNRLVFTVIFHSGNVAQLGQLAPTRAAIWLSAIYMCCRTRTEIRRIAVSSPAFLTFAEIQGSGAVAKRCDWHGSQLAGGSPVFAL